MQEAFFRALTRFGSLKGHSPFSTWLTRIAINEALMELRSLRPTVSPDDEGRSENDSFVRGRFSTATSDKRNYASRNL